MNKTLLNLNKENLNDSEKSLLNKQQIIGGLKSHNIDNNDEIAIILNVLAENLHLLVDSKNKDELISLLDKRKEIKNTLK